MRWEGLWRISPISTIPDASNRKHFYIRNITHENKGINSSYHFDLRMKQSYTFGPVLGSKWILR